MKKTIVHHQSTNIQPTPEQQPQNIFPPGLSAEEGEI